MSEPSLVTFLGVGAMVGAAVGAGIGFGARQAVVVRRRRQQAKNELLVLGDAPQPLAVDATAETASGSTPGTPTPSTVATPAAAPTPPVDAGSAGKREVLGVSVRYLVNGGEFYVALQRLHDFLPASDKYGRDLFAYVVAGIDNILGLESLLTSRYAEKKSSFPLAAQRGRNNLKTALQTLIDHNLERFPSKTRSDDMNKLRIELMTGVDAIVKGMHQTVAAATV